MREYLPILIVGAIIGSFTLAFLIAYGALRRSKEHFDDSERSMPDGEIIRRLLAYAKKYPKLCKVTEKKRNGGMRFVIDKQRISIRLTAPYSAERREAASQYAKEHSTIMQKNGEDNNGTVCV